MKILVCGSRRKTSYYDKVFAELMNLKSELENNDDTLEIIEGCCEKSADEYAEFFGKLYGVKVNHYPAEEKKHLLRNRIMIDDCDKVIAFWDGYSYGTAYTISHAVLNGKKVKIIKI